MTEALSAIYWRNLEAAGKARKYDPDTDSPQAQLAYTTAVSTIARLLGMGEPRPGGPRNEQREADVQVAAHMVWAWATKVEKLLEALLQRPGL